MNNNSKGFTLQDAILVIGMQSRSGELMLESGNNIGTMLFYRSNVLHAFSPYSRAIGDLLVEAGVITENDLIEALLLQKNSVHVPLGSMLTKSGKVTYDVIEMMVHEQIRQAVKEFQSWPDMTFSFIEKDIIPHDNIHLPVHVFIQPETIQSVSKFFAVYEHATNPVRQQPGLSSIV
jgi:hypothetical protein